MNADWIGLLMVDLVVAGATSAVWPRWAGQFYWPRCLATVVDRTVFSACDGTLLVRFVPPDGTAVEAHIANVKDDPRFLARHPVGSAVRICYRPGKPQEAWLPAAPPPWGVGLSLLLLVNGWVICTMLRAGPTP